MSKPSKNPTALVVLSDRELTYNEQQLPKLQAAAIAQIQQIRTLEREGAARAILAGLTLHRVKASLKFGQFMPWLKGNVQGVAYSQCNYYMRLASVFVEKCRVSKPDLLALPGDQTSLAITSETEGRALLEKLSAFVGDRSLRDLLEKHGIKNSPKLGGARDAGEKDPQAPVDPEMLYLQSRDEIGSVIHRAETLLISENRLQHLAGHPEEIRGVAESLRSLADKIEKAAEALLANKAA
ncbi:MAG: hypothetical protein WC378_19610 [Opitutaceae bacterium]|jgi:hypothetical protein